MKIALINNLYPPFARGGAEKVVADMVADWQNQQQVVFLITTKPHRVDEPKNSALKTYYLSSYFFNLHKLPLIGRFFWQLGNIFNYSKARQIKKILETQKPDLVVTHNLMGLGWLVPRIIKRLKIRHEHFLHDIQLLHPSGLMIYGQEEKINSLTAKTYQFLTRALFSSPHQIISPSRWLLEQHRQRNFFSKSLTLVNPFQKSKEKIVTKEINQPKKILFVGQIETHKGILFLIKTFKKIIDPHKTLTIIGDGQKLASAQRLAAGDQRIKFLGRLPLKQTEEIMNTQDCLVVPSFCYENSPTIIDEAHRHNLPIIAANIGGIPEIMGKNDRLFRPGDENDLENKLK